MACFQYCKEILEIFINGQFRKSIQQDSNKVKVKSKEGWLFKQKLWFQVYDPLQFYWSPEKVQPFFVVDLHFHPDFENIFFEKFKARFNIIRFNIVLQAQFFIILLSLKWSFIFELSVLQSYLVKLWKLGKNKYPIPLI